MNTTITVICMHCGHVIRTKEGFGQTGVSSGICNSCLWQHYPDYAAEVFEDREGRAA